MGIFDGIVSGAATVLKAAGAVEAGTYGLKLSGEDPANRSAGGRFYMGDMVYPSDLVNEDIGRNSYICIKFNAYERRSIFDKTFFKAIGGITLPLPSSLNDSTSVNWSTSQNNAQNAAVGAGIEQLLEGGNFKGAAASGNFTETAMNLLKGTKSSASDGTLTSAIGAGLGAAGASVISNAFGGAGAQALQLGGLAQNPFMTMLFQSPNFKSHSFSWMFAPRNAYESASINAIINAFKFNMLPGLSGGGSGGIFFKYPNVADITLYPTNAYLYKFKPAVVKSVTVDYAPNGPSFFQGTYAPTHISLAVEFQEIEYWTKENFTDTGNGKFNSNIAKGIATFADDVSRGFNTITDKISSQFNTSSQQNSGQGGNQNAPNLHTAPDN